MTKIITKFDAELIRRAVNRIAEPIVQTLTPLGRNVMFEKDLHTIVTNDGVTIAKLIDSEDETEDAIIQMVKYGSIATNQIAGDGTSSTVLYTNKLVDMGLDEIAKGKQPMRLKKELLAMKDEILASAERFKSDVTPRNLFEIACVSSGGDTNIAETVVEVIDTAGQDGMIFIEESRNQKTRVKKDSGYNLESGMFDLRLSNAGPGKAEYIKPYVFVTDKKLYHVEECREILEQAHKYGARQIVIVARDFLGESPDFFIANHISQDVPFSILLIKVTTPDTDTTTIQDIATYLGGPMFSEKVGKLMGKLTADHFILTEKVYAFSNKTVFVTSNKANPELSFLIEELRKKKEEDPENDTVKRRLASLTTGTVTLEVGAATGPELRELIFRFEDAINATRAALRSGYVVGGGLTLYNSTRELNGFAKEFGLCGIKQIAENCGAEFEQDKYIGDVGFNAASESFSNLREDGIIEPFDVFKHSLTNAVSIANEILTTGWIIVNKSNKENDSK